MVHVGSAPSVLQLGTSPRGPEGEGQSPHKASFKQKRGEQMPPYFFLFFKSVHIVLAGQDTQRSRWSRGSVFSLELSSEGLAHFLPLNQPVGGVGMLGRASILHHRAICLALPFGINDGA